MTPRIEDALAGAQAFRTLGRAFAPVPVLAPLAADLDAWRARSSGPIAVALAAACEALRVEGDQLADEQDRLLGGRGGVPARESSYADPRRIAPSDLADACAFHRAFGLEAGESPPDHIASECELASILLLKVAYALAEGWSEQAETTEAAYRSWISDHLARWAPDLCARIREEAPFAFHRAVAETLEQLVVEESTRLGVELHAPVCKARTESDVFDCASHCPAAAGECR